MSEKTSIDQVGVRGLEEGKKSRYLRRKDGVSNSLALQEKTTKKGETT